MSLSSLLSRAFFWAEARLPGYEDGYLVGQVAPYGASVNLGCPAYDGTCVGLPHGWYSVRGLSLRQRLALWCGLCSCLAEQCSCWYFFKFALRVGLKGFGSCFFRGWFHGLSF